MQQKENNMKNILLASTSTLFGGQYLEYLETPIKELFNGIDEIIFIPFARPGGISHDDYTAKVAAYFSNLQIKVKGLHTFDNPKDAINKAKGFFTGGGNTFLLLKALYEMDVLENLKSKVEQGTPYLGASAGSNIAGINIRTTNDMPIVYPPSFDALGWIPFNLNPHYLDPIEGLQHNGETRETRILEFLTQNDIPVIGLREGSWIRIQNNEIILKGPHTARIFSPGKEIYELAAESQIFFDN